MNEQTATLLQNLATKLGTTSEYLWGVLLKQAPIAAWTMVFQYTMTLVVLALLWRFRVAIGTWIGDRQNEDSYPFVVIGLIVFGIVSTVWLLACILCFDNLVTAFLNPEYWALKEVLSAVKK